LREIIMRVVAALLLAAVAADAQSTCPADKWSAKKCLKKKAKGFCTLTSAKCLKSTKKCTKTLSKCGITCPIAGLASISSTAACKPLNVTYESGLPNLILPIGETAPNGMTGQKDWIAIFDAKDPLVPATFMNASTFSPTVPTVVKGLNQTDTDGNVKLVSGTKFTNLWFYWPANQLSMSLASLPIPWRLGGTKRYKVVYFKDDGYVAKFPAVTFKEKYNFNNARTSPACKCVDLANPASTKKDAKMVEKYGTMNPFYGSGCMSWDAMLPPWNPNGRKWCHVDDSFPFREYYDAGAYFGTGLAKMKKYVFCEPLVQPPSLPPSSPSPAPPPTPPPPFSPPVGRRR